MEISNELSALIVDLLGLASDEFSNHGCNDFEVNDTPENRRLVQKLQTIFYGEHVDIRVHDGKILSNDYVLMGAISEFLKL